MEQQDREEVLRKRQERKDRRRAENTRRREEREADYAAYMAEHPDDTWLDQHDVQRIRRCERQHAALKARAAEPGSRRWTLYWDRVHYSVVVHLDELSPLARTLAAGSIGNIHDDLFTIQVVAKQSRREMNPPTPEVEATYDLEGWWDHHPSICWDWSSIQSLETPEQYFEREAAEIDRLGWRFDGLWHAWAWPGIEVQS